MPTAKALRCSHAKRVVLKGATSWVFAPKLKKDPLCIITMDLLIYKKATIIKTVAFSKHYSND